MVRSISGSRTILGVALSNIGQTLSKDLFAITECIDWCSSSLTRPWPMQSFAKSVSRNGGVYKLELIERDNPQWRDLYDELTYAFSQTGLRKNGPCGAV